MAKGVLRKLLIWHYERGTLQYDIICVLILVFIFLVPKSCFVARPAPPPAAGSTQTSEANPLSKAPATAISETPPRR